MLRIHERKNDQFGHALRTNPLSEYGSNGLLQSLTCAVDAGNLTESILSGS
jgi:hypothetical protein